MITTKMGKIGAPTVSYSMSGTFTQRPRYTDRGFYMMNSKERVDVSRELMEMGVRYNGVYDGISDWIGYEKAYLDYFMDSSISYDEFKRQSQWYETMNTDWLNKRCVLSQSFIEYKRGITGCSLLCFNRVC